MKKLSASCLFLFAVSAWAEEPPTRVMIPEPNGPYLRRDVVVVPLPASTAYDKGSDAERAYLEGYSMGYMDARNGRIACRPNVGNRVKYPSWNLGWEAGYKAASAPADNAGK